VLASYLVSDPAPHNKFVKNVSHLAPSPKITRFSIVAVPPVCTLYFLAYEPIQDT
jgi:hypothetical protein